MTQNRKHNNNRPFKKVNYSNPYNILPPTDVLDEYERLSPGSVDELVEMAKKEQEHRHVWQEEHLKVHGRIHRWGQIFAFIYNIILLYGVWSIHEAGNTQLALKVFIINAGLMTLALFTTFIERRIMNRRPPRKFPAKSSNYKGKK